VTSSKRPIPSAYFRLARGARGTLRQDGEPRGPQLWHPLPPMGTTSWPNKTPVISPRQHSYLYSNGVTTTIPSNPPLYANPSAHVARPRWHRGAQDKVWPQHVAPADGEAKRWTPVTSMRYRKTVPPDKEEDSHARGHLFLFFSFIFFHSQPRM
jgi:hypothetical protein